MIVDPFFIFAPIYGPLCLFLIFRREAKRDAHSPIWPTLGTILLAVPAAYGLGALFLLLLSLPDGSLPRSNFNALMTLALAGGALSAAGAHAAAVIRRRKRAEGAQK